ncbi:MAG: hypothetical protein OXL68_15220 [Paracoccaceae bacterium]|nr:hypothetical protein [Paracoccaceae bacterium]
MDDSRMAAGNWTVNAVARRRPEDSLSEARGVRSDERPEPGALAIRASTVHGRLRFRGRVSTGPCSLGDVTVGAGPP